MKTLLNHILHYAREQQSKQSGYFHYCYEAPDSRDTIPVLENFLFILALLQEKSGDSLQEGKDLLHKLLLFQEPEQGNFPVYLHEFPQCKHPYLALHILEVLYWIQRDFQKIFDQSLRLQLTQTIDKLFVYLANVRLPISLDKKNAAVQYAFGKSTSLPALPSEEEIFCTETLGDLLAAFQLIDPKLSFCSEVWPLIQQTWYSPCQSSIAPSIQRSFFQKKGLSSLYDLFFLENFDQLIPGPYLLKGVLIQEQIKALPPSVNYQDNGREIFQSAEYAYSLCKKELIPQQDAGMFYPLQMLWGSAEHPHHLCFHVASESLVDYLCKGQSIEFFVTLPLKKPEDKKNTESREMIFSVFSHDDFSFHVANEACNTFKCGEKITFHCCGRIISISFTVKDGRGKFFGHIMRGNRPSQRGCRGEARFQANDWQIFLRTVEREEECQCKVVMTIEEG